MRLKSFRVQNYKKVEDTGVISTGNLTVLVGKNEAGKSAVLRALSKLNPSDGEKFDGLKEFPRRRFTDEFTSQDWPAITGTFTLSDDDRRDLVSVCSALENVTEVTCTRHFSGDLDVSFAPTHGIVAVVRRDYSQTLAKAIQLIEGATAPDGKGELWAPIKKAMLTSLRAVEESFKPRQADDRMAAVDVHRAVEVMSNALTEEWHRGIFGAVLTTFQVLEQQAATDDALDAADKWVEENLPKFIYFDKYDVLDSAIHIPTLRRLIDQSSHEAKVRTTHCLFKHVGLDLAKVADLGLHNRGQGADSPAVRRQIDERAIRAASAEIAMTGKFADWWLQRKHEFRYQVDGDYFRVWVSDDLDPSPIELDQRSTGMQYFFSFYLVFLVEREGQHQDAILLLDEPGGSLHGTAQQKIVKFLEKISPENQTIYTTHHPFMVDPDHLERARAVFEDPRTGTTRVAEDIWPKDKDCLFPLQAALGYQVAQSLFVSKRQLVVEGITDFWLLKTLDLALKARGLAGFRTDVTTVPAGGASNVAPLASMLIGHDVEVLVLLDGDDTGDRHGRKLKTGLFADSPGKVMFASDFLPNGAKETESFLPDEWVVEAAKKGYPSLDFAFLPAEAKILNIVERIKVAAKRQGVEKLEKWRLVAPLRDRLLEKPKDLPEANAAAVQKFFDAANATFTL